MLEKERKELYRKLLTRFGQSQVELKAVQECSELIQAISRKYTTDINPHTSDEIQDEIINELADVITMTDQLMCLYGEQRVMMAWDKKMNRLKEWIEDE